MLLLSETGSEDDGLLDLSDDDFFVSGSSSDEADADDEWTDKSTRLDTLVSRICSLLIVASYRNYLFLPRVNGHH